MTPSYTQPQPPRHFSGHTCPEIAWGTETRPLHILGMSSAQHSPGPVGSRSQEQRCARAQAGASEPPAGTGFTPAGHGPLCLSFPITSLASALLESRMMLLTVYLYVMLGLGKVGPSPDFLIHCPISIPTCHPEKVLQPGKAPGCLGIP